VLGLDLIVGWRLKRQHPLTPPATDPGVAAESDGQSPGRIAPPKSVQPARRVGRCAGGPGVAGGLPPPCRR
jgi:hypothetical protein